MIIPVVIDASIRQHACETFLGILRMTDSASEAFTRSTGMSISGVRRAKAAFPSGCESHPAIFAPAGSNRSRHGGNEVAEASDATGHFR